jgi:glycosyltransferase involved in cell wall biosynthesis
VNLVDDLTVMIITFNEDDNLERTLEAVSWAKKILVIDSGSTDGTRAIVDRFLQADVVEREFDTFANQCNFGLSRVSTGWVLSMDADYVVSAGLAAELGRLEPGPEIGGFRASFRYMVHGRILKASLYPSRCVLYRVEGARYRDEGHGHRVEVAGEVASLRVPIFHDDRKPLSRWMRSQATYAAREAEYLLTTRRAELNFADRLRLAGWLMPLIAPLHALIFKRCIFDGLAGWHYAAQRMLAETAIALELADRRIASK